MMSSPGGPLTVIILIDALGWEIVNQTGFCRGLLPSAGPLDTVLGYSSAAIPSLLSGTPPSEHGSWAMYRYAPDRSPFKLLRYLPRLPHPMEWRVRVLTKWFIEKRKTIRGYYDLYEIPLNVLGYFDVAQRGDPYTPGGLARESFFDHLKKEGVGYRVWTYKTPEEENFRALLDAIDTGEQVLFFYTAELDALMHRVGIGHNDVVDKLKLYEEYIGKIIAVAAGKGREASVFLFSDHGMTDVDTVVDLKGEVKKWGYKIGRDFLPFYDSTMARFWCTPGIKGDLVARLNDTGWGRVIPDAELESLGCGFDDDAYGEVIFLVDPGKLIVPSYMGQEPVAAMHGYHPGDPYSRGCFLTNNPKCPRPGSILDLKELLVRQVREGF